MTSEITLSFLEILQKRLIRRSTIISGIFILASMVFFQQLLAAAILIAIGAISIIYKRYISIGIDFELCSLCAVAVGLIHGPVAGAFSGGISILLALFLNGHLLENPFFALIKVVSFALLGVIAGIFTAANPILIAGIYTFIADAAFVFVALHSGGNSGKLLVFLFTHTFIVVYQLKLLLPIAKAVL